MKILYILTSLFFVVSSALAKESFIDKDATWWASATPEMIEKLIIQGANINDIDNNGFSPLYKASVNSSYSVVEYMLNNGANTNIKRSPLHILYTRMLHKENEVKKIIELLINKGMNINIQDEYGNTPLINSTTLLPDLDYIKILLNNGADINIKNNKGQTALMCAVSCALAIPNSEIDKQIPNIVNFLINNGANMNVKDKTGKTALHYLFSGEPCYSDLYDIQKNMRSHTIKLKSEVNSTVLKSLLTNKKNVNSKDINGVTPLMLLSLIDNNKGNIELLINNGADVNIKDHNGLTVFDYAKLNPYLNQKTLLLLYSKMREIVNLNTLNCFIEYNKEICEDSDFQPFTGIAIFYNNYGDPISKIPYENGLVDGIVRAYDAIDKHIYFKAKYKNGNLLKSKCFDKYGNIIKCKCSMFNWKIRNIVKECH